MLVVNVSRFDWRAALVELMSIYKRLRSFEHELDGDKIQEVTHTLS